MLKLSISKKAISSLLVATKSYFSAALALEAEAIKEDPSFPSSGTQVASITTKLQGLLLLEDFSYGRIVQFNVSKDEASIALSEEATDLLIKSTGKYLNTVLEPTLEMYTVLRKITPSCTESVNTYFSEVKGIFALQKQPK